MLAITPDLLQRARGCLLGAAVGDAFAMALEGAPRQPVNAQVREMRRGRLEAGTFTGDTELLLAVATSLQKPQPLASAELAGQPAGPPRAIAYTRALVGRLTGARPRAVTVDDEAGLEGTRALIRSLPLALAHADNRNVCLEEARNQGRLIHPAPECVAGAAFVAAVLWHLLRGMAPRQAVQQGLGVCGDLPEELAAAIRQAPGHARDRLANDGRVQSTLVSVIWGLQTTASYPEAVTRVANLGGRATTATALVGALAGAAYRHSGIPADWREQVHGLWPPRNGRLWREKEFVALAEELVHGAGRWSENRTD